LLPVEELEQALRGLEPEQITGPGGLLTQLAGRVIETALGAELTERLGYPPGQAPPGGAGNVRNGSTAKTVQIELGAVAVNTPRDRHGSFEPKLVAKRQTRLAGLDDKILGLYAGGMTVRDIERHLAGLYGVQIGRDTISRVTDAVLEDVAAWRSRPLEEVYPVLFLDALVVKVREAGAVRRKACYLAVGITCDGERDVLGLWWQDTEGAKFWLQVLTDLKQRGVADVLVCCVDGLKGFPEAIEAVYPQAWVQTCIVHLIRHSLRFVGRREREKVARALRPIYTATDPDAAMIALEAFEAEWGTRYPVIGQAWRAAWEQVIPFLAFAPDVRRVIYTTNNIEALNHQIRKVTKTRGHFPDEQAASKLIYLAITSAQQRWGRPQAWTRAMLAFKIHFGDRYPSRTPTTLPGLTHRRSDSLASDAIALGS
jgi:transposase-like protein